MSHDKSPASNDRQNQVLDTRLLNSASVVAIGAGRQSETVRTLSDSGINLFDIVDPDIVEEGNIGQTNYFPSSIRRLKVDALADEIVETNPHAIVRKWPCKGEEIVRLPQRLIKRSAVLIGIDNTAAMFCLADISQKVGTDTFVCGTTGDCSQHFVAFIHKEGPMLRDLLPLAWKGVQSGYRPPAFFASCKAFSQSLNVKSVLAACGVLHYRAGSNLRIADVGEALMEKPLIIGSNGIHGDFFNPARMLGLDEIRGL